MLTIALATLFTFVALASLTSLADSVIKWRSAYRLIKAARAHECSVRELRNDAAVVVLHPALAKQGSFSPSSTPAPLVAAA